MVFKKGKKSTGSRVLMLLLAISLVFVLAGCGGGSEKNSAGPSAEDQKPIELKLAHFWPVTHTVETEIAQGWIEAVEDATNGRVKITTYPGETLLKAAEIYEGVVKGVADIGMYVPSYNRGRFPVIETFSLPGIGNKSSVAASLAVMEGIKILNPKELQDTHHIFSWATGPGNLISKEPVRELKDIKGKPIGVSVGPRTDAIKLLGASPISLPMPEWYEALSKGMMKAGVTPLETMKGFRLGEVTGDYITMTPFIYNSTFSMAMNLDKWNSLPADIQQQITEASDKFYAENVPGAWDKLNEEGLKWVQEKKKVEIINLSDEEVAKWVELIKPVRDAHVADLKSKGLDGDEILSTVMELAEKYNKQ